MGDKAATGDEFVAKARAVHGDFYDYSKVVYRNSRTAVIVVCPSHGQFSQLPKGHISGQGCSRCGRNGQKDTPEFIRCAVVKHGIRYSYNDVVYQDSVSKVSIVCSKHGSFLQTPTDHLSGAGCQRCKGETLSKLKSHTTESFSAKAIKVHGDTYDYSETDYVASQTNVNIRCRVHGMFAQQPSNHLAGKGCSKCRKCGFSTEKAASLYVLTSGNITKVGITNRDVKFRLDEINRSSKRQFTAVSVYVYSLGLSALNAEIRALKYLSNNYAAVGEVFGGSTECFLNVDRQKLIQLLLCEHS